MTMTTIIELTGSAKTVADGTWRLKQSPTGEVAIGNAGTLRAGPKTRVWTADARDELDALAATLTAPQTPAQAAAEYFATLDPALQQQFGAAFQAISAVPLVRDKITALEAVTVSDALAATKARFLELLRGA